MEGEDTEKLFLNKKPADLLIELRRSDSGNYASALSSSADVTYSHTVKCLQRFESQGLVRFERKGRRKEVLLTEDGDEAAKQMFDLIKTLASEPEQESVIEDYEPEDIL